MKPSREHIKDVQAFLSAAGLYSGEVDGLVGKLTFEACRKYIVKNIAIIAPARTALTLEDWQLIPFTMQLTCYLAYGANQSNTLLNPGPIDGLFGIQTLEAWDELMNSTEQGFFRFNNRPDITIPEVAEKPNRDWPMPVYGSTGFDQLFGERGSNLVRFKPLYPHISAYNERPVISFEVNKAIFHRLTVAQTKIVKAYSLNEIKQLGLDLFGGCYVNRTMRGSNKWSTHAWAIALDYDPARNPLKADKTTAQFARPEYEPWFEAWESSGFLSLGRYYNFDYMHVQACCI